MTLQRRLLNAMLGLLALAALAGVSTIFLPGGEFIGRVAGTLLCAAIAIALALPPSKKLGIQAERTAGLITLLAIVIAFTLAFISIWAEFFYRSLTWHLPVSTVAYVACVIPALAFLSIAKSPGGKICSIGGVAFSAIVFLAWLLGIWMDFIGSRTVSENFFKTTGLLTGASLPICASLFGDLADRKYWRWIGVVSGLAAIAMGLVGIWYITGGKPTNIIYCLIISATIGGINVLLRASLTEGMRWLALGTSGMLAVTGVLGIFVNYVIDGNPNSGFDDLSIRLLAASAIVTVCGILAIVVLKAFNKRVVITEARSINDIKSMTVHCPRCTKKQNAALGESRCGDCGLIFLFRVAEPHCIKCNYTLFDIRSGRCPECGEPIAGGAQTVNQGI